VAIFGGFRHSARHLMIAMGKALAASDYRYLYNDLLVCLGIDSARMAEFLHLSPVLFSRLQRGEETWTDSGHIRVLQAFEVMRQSFGENDVKAMFDATDRIRLYAILSKLVPDFPLRY